MTIDTITAIATANGTGGVGIIRISGPKCVEISNKITKKQLKPRYAHYGDFYESESQVLDSGIALFFPSPNSYTGEDVVELQAHGGQVVLDLLLKRSIALGARLAKPGEFTERAYLNDKIDLLQAEAIADLINSSTEQAARSAQRSLRGDFSKKINALQELLGELRVFVEAALDFPEEEIDFIAESNVVAQLQDINNSINSILATAKQGSLLQGGINIAIAGKPNAGKSSLLNCLAGYDSAIVTNIAGTTRDILREQINIEGMPIQFIDTAGLRESSDLVEQEGIRRAYKEFETADLILYLVDASKDQRVSANECWGQELANTSLINKTLLVRNKIDLTQEPTGADVTTNTIRLSAANGEGIALLRKSISAKVGFIPCDDNQFIARRRHIDALEKAQNAIRNGELQLRHSGAAELLAEDLRDAQAALSAITGEVSADQLLGDIFSNFCIGK